MCLHDACHQPLALCTRLQRPLLPYCHQICAMRHAAASTPPAPELLHQILHNTRQHVCKPTTVAAGLQSSAGPGKVPRVEGGELVMKLGDKGHKRLTVKTLKGKVIVDMREFYVVRWMF